ncbi:MAG TPA: carbamate kinase [Chloroflexota bacterium]
MADFLVVAFGGNAILRSGQRGTLQEQRDNVRQMACELGRLLADGHRIVVTHGNGPQVGEIMLKSELARDTVPPLTLDVGGAMSQGQIGYLLQQEIGNYLARAGTPGSVCSVVTQVVVDPTDTAFNTTTKPIGRFYSREESEGLAAERGWRMVEDAGRGYRRVVPSPMPQIIEEWHAVRTLVEAGVLVIAAGGGGIPVVREADGSLRGVEAVIDKDLSAQRLATLVGARTLVLLTEVDRVALDFGTPAQCSLEVVGLDEIKRHYAAGQFPAGSMGPKVRAGVNFLEAGGERVIITSAQKLVSAVNGRSAGTQIVQMQESARGNDLTLSGQAP